MWHFQWLTVSGNQEKHNSSESLAPGDAIGPAIQGHGPAPMDSIRWAKLAMGRNHGKVVKTSTIMITLVGYVTYIIL